MFDDISPRIAGMLSQTQHYVDKCEANNFPKTYSAHGMLGSVSLKTSQNDRIPVMAVQI